MYKWVSLVHLLPEVYKFPSTIFHGLIHIWIVVEPHQMVLNFSMFQDGRKLENFSMVRNKYNEMDDVIKLI